MLLTNYYIEERILVRSTRKMLSQKKIEGIFSIIKFIKKIMVVLALAVTLTAVTITLMVKVAKIVIIKYNGCVFLKLKSKFKNLFS